MPGATQQHNSSAGTATSTEHIHVDALALAVEVRAWARVWETARQIQAETDNAGDLHDWEAHWAFANTCAARTATELIDGTLVSLRQVEVLLREVVWLRDRVSDLEAGLRGVTAVGESLLGRHRSDEPPDGVLLRVREPAQVEDIASGEHLVLLDGERRDRQVPEVSGQPAR